MKIKFDSALEYQSDAINAVTEVFEGQPLAQSSFEISDSVAGGMLLNDLGIGNQISLSDEELLANTKKIQAKNKIEQTKALQGRNFSVEMETGTGKTYVYLRSIFELSQKYGLKKFIVVVPGVAVREGVLKAIEMTKDHFLSLYENEPFDYFVYDSKKLGRVRQFASSNRIQIMVINIQSFVKDIADKDTAEMTEAELKKLNVINRENDKMEGRKPIDFIQSTNPIVIIDEPQSVDNTPPAQRAIANLNPAATLRYSATHRNPHNLLYKLDPVRAYDLNLVKRIEVASPDSDENFNDAYVKLLATDNKRGIRAQVEIHKESRGKVKAAKMWVKQGDDLYAKSGGRENYAQNYIVKDIDCTPSAELIEFNGGGFLDLGKEMGGMGDDIMKAQVWETVEQHLRKERALRGMGIKALSLFFIDKVANYRVYKEDGTPALGKIGEWFEAAYKELTAKAMYKDFAPKALGHDVAKMHDGYFSIDKQNKAKDTSGKTAEDESAYNLIMREKERLLDIAEPLRFIFSHSALREGWDNPNVFQICTLNETASREKKRQEIGRGLRLPVNQQGERVHDKNINRLTVIANESYDSFARSLQKELEDDFNLEFGRIEKTAFAKIVRPRQDGTEEAIGREESAKIWEGLKAGGYIDENGKILDKFDPKKPQSSLKIGGEYEDIKPAVIDEIQRHIFKNRVVNARDQKTLKLRKEVLLGPEFKALWDKIKHRTRYRVEFSTDDLICRAAERIKALEEIKQARIFITRVAVDLDYAGVSANRRLGRTTHSAANAPVLPDLLAYLQKETELTRHTLLEILKKSGRLGEFIANPQKFMSLAAREISRALHDLMLEGIKYEKVANHYWEMSRIEKDDEAGITRYLDNLYKVQNEEKSVYDAIEFDSEVERQFAEDLDNNEDVRLFVKLPRWFTIDTPIGPYNPDWAFVTEREEKLYFVRETKGTKDRDDLRTKENQKIDCGRSHFNAIGVNYDVATSLDDVDF